MRTCAALLFLLILPACALVSHSATMKDQFCGAFTTWMNARPQGEQDKRYVKLSHGGCGEGAICMYSIKWVTECDGCADEQDEVFVAAIAPMTHYISIDELAEYSEQCISVGRKLEIDVLDELAEPQSAIVHRQDKDVAIRWERSDCGFYGCTELEVTYN